MNPAKLDNRAFIILAALLFVLSCPSDQPASAQKSADDNVDAIKKLIEKRDYMSWIKITYDSTDSILKVEMISQIGISYCRAGMIEEACKIIDNLDKYLEKSESYRKDGIVACIVKEMANTPSYKRAVEYATTIITKDNEKTDLLAELVVFIFKQDKNMAIDLLKNNKSRFRDYKVFGLIVECIREDQLIDAERLSQLLQNEGAKTAYGVIMTVFKKLRGKRNTPNISAEIESLISDDENHIEAARLFLVNCGKAGKADVVKILIEKRGRILDALALTDAANGLLDKNEKDAAEMILKELKQRVDEENKSDIFEYLYTVLGIMELDYKLGKIEDAKKLVEKLVKAYDKIIVPQSRVLSKTVLKKIFNILCCLGKENEAIERAGQYQFYMGGDELLLAEELSALKKNEALFELWEKSKEIHGPKGMHLYYAGGANGIAREQSSRVRTQNAQSRPATQSK